jgi:pimeloyl-ACP methyl ester carboxylesterase
MFYQFEGPLLRLMIDENYRLLVQGDQQAYLFDAADGAVPPASLWVYRFYDRAATTFVPQPHKGLAERLFGKLHHLVTDDGFEIETAAEGLYGLIELVLAKTGAPKVHLVAHSMGGLVARCMMQKVCAGPERRRARDLVAKLFTYGTPHGGITFDIAGGEWIERTFGPVGSKIFAPEKMYGYLTPEAKFDEEPDPDAQWDPQRIDEQVFSASDIFCLIGTDPQDYGLPKFAVGPKSDGLVLIDRAYVRGAHRAYVHKSHSGRYGEVNSEEGYQNLRRFLFGRWAVTVDLRGLPPYPKDMDERPPDQQCPVWQADMRLAIRGVSVVISEQQAAHWCPIQINQELGRHVDSPDSPVPLVSTFLLDARDQRELAAQRGDASVAIRHGGRLRYTLTLRVYKLVERDGAFRFADHLEQVPDWADSLIVDVGPDDTGTTLQAWAAWNSEVAGPNDTFDPITDGLDEERRGPLPIAEADGAYRCQIPLPAVARTLSVLGADAYLGLHVVDRAGKAAQHPRAS